MGDNFFKKISATMVSRKRHFSALDRLKGQDLALFQRFHALKVVYYKPYSLFTKQIMQSRSCIKRCILRS